MKDIPRDRPQWMVLRNSDIAEYRKRVQVRTCQENERHK